MRMKPNGKGRLRKVDLSGIEDVDMDERNEVDDGQVEARHEAEVEDLVDDDGADY